MRTTINLDDDVLAAAKAKRRMSGENLGKILSAWAKAGMDARTTSHPNERKRSGLPAFSVGENAPLIAADRASDLLDEEA